MGFFSLSTNQNRIFGLDLLRFMAIFFVLLGHSTILIPPAYKSMIRTFVIDGVGIFFVLSGFLIGQILFKQINRKETSFKNLVHFWSRRWLRTIPAYFFILTFLLIFTYFLVPKKVPQDWYEYYFFLQNFNSKQAAFFQESWSLSVEEWFYLLIPSLFFIQLLLFKHNKTSLLYTLLLLVVLIILYRFYLFNTIGGSSFRGNILEQVLPRLDGIMLGVIGAYLAMYHKKIWDKFVHFSWFLLMFGMFYALKSFNPSTENLLYCVFNPTIKSIFVLFMLPFLSQWNIKKSSYLTKTISFISITSYSAYLINRTVVIDILIKFGIHGNLHQKHQTNLFWVLEYGLFWLSTFILAFLLYKFIEIPFLKLRDRN